MYNLFVCIHPIHVVIPLSTLVLNSRDRYESLWLPQRNASTEQPDSNIFLQHAAIQSIGMMLLAP